MNFEDNPIFIDRKKEIDNLIQILSNNKIIIIEGEQGVGKSKILDNLHNKLKVSPSPHFVGYYSNDKALVGKSFSESSIFVILLEDFLKWINENYHIKGKLHAEKEKVKEVTIKFLKKRGTEIAKKIARDLLDKIGLSGLVDIAEEFGEEYNQQKSIFETLEEYIDETKGKELLFTSMEILEAINEILDNKKFIFLIDRFESLNETTITFFLNLMKFTSFSFVTAITKYKNYGNNPDRKKIEEFIHACNHEFTVNRINITGLLEEDIKEWIKTIRHKVLLDVDITEIRQKTSGLPVLLEGWINNSKNLDKKEIDLNKFCQSIIYQYSDIDADILLKIKKLSILKYPLNADDSIISYLNLNDIDEYDILLNNLIKYGIFDKNSGWFRNNVIQDCFRNEILEEQRSRYHSEIANYYGVTIEKNTNMPKIEKLNNLIEYGYHLHNSKSYEKSYDINFKTGEEMINAGNLSIATICLELSILDSLQLNDTHKKMESLFLISTKILMIKGELEKAETNFNDLLTYYEKIDNKNRQFTICDYLGRILRTRGKYPEALEKYEKSLEIAENTKNYDSIAVALNNMGIVNYHLIQLNEALNNYRKALFIARIIGDEQKISNGLVNIADIYDRFGEFLYHDNKNELASQVFDEALELYKQAYDIDEKLEDELAKSKVKNSIGLLYLHKKEYDKALKYLEESLTIKNKIGHYEGIYNSLYNIGLVYSDKNENDNALQNFENALEMARFLGNEREIKKVESELKKIRN